jgi:hypothetical protein
LRDFGLDRRIILKWMSNWFEECGLDWSGSGLGPLGSLCEHSNGTRGST